MWVMDILYSMSGLWVYESPDSSVDSLGSLEDGKFHMRSTTYSFYFCYIELINSYLKIYSYITYLMAIPISILRAVSIFNPISCTSVKFTIIYITWHNFIPYSILFTWVNFRLVLSTLAYMFKYRLFPLLLQQHIRALLFYVFVLGTQWY